MGQAMKKLKTGEPTHNLANEIKNIIENLFDNEDIGKGIGAGGAEITYDDVYRFIFKIIEELRRTQGGAMQYKLPSKPELEAAWGKHHKSGGALTKAECKAIINEVFTLQSFSLGQGTDVFLYLFGFPVCALMAKKFIPGLRSISDDVIIPVATSGSVIFLAKTHRL